MDPLRLLKGPQVPQIYIYIYIFHNLIHIYEISVVHLSFLCMYLPCDEMFLYNKQKNYGVKFILNIPGALKHNIKNVEVFR